MTAAVAKPIAARVRRPVYLTVRKVVDVETGEHVVALVPMSRIDARLLGERKFDIGCDVRADLKQPRNTELHRLVHSIGHLLVDNLEDFRGLSSHDSIKRLQREADVFCDSAEVEFGSFGKFLVRVPRSIAFDEMCEEDFMCFFKSITSHIVDGYVHLMTEEVRIRFYLMTTGINSDVSDKSVQCDSDTYGKKIDG